jgi:hypothetical protein
MKSFDAEKKQPSCLTRISTRASYWNVLASLFLFCDYPIGFLRDITSTDKDKRPTMARKQLRKSYIYLSADVKGEAPFHIDYPGTTTQFFGAACLQSSWHDSINS